MKIESLDVLKAQKQIAESNVSFLEDVNQMVIDACYQDIAEQLLENWINSNLEEGQYYADKQFAWMSDDKFVQSEFNKFYNLTEIDEDYFEIL